MVGLIYVTATEALHGTDLLGAVQVDMRDRVVHPLLAGLAGISLLLGKRRSQETISDR